MATKTTMKWSILLAVLVSMVIVNKVASYDRTKCSETVLKLLPCEGYLTGDKEDPKPSPDCCKSVKSLDEAAKLWKISKKKDLCLCLKEMALMVKTIHRPRAQELPKYCKLSSLINIVYDADCSIK
ncbi:non-specific lipid-transfer protein-like [Impatiens glandulifera]|uniref:non-specific lipid-transfer protein-like n=1 Tax=Impatiens glandulifera TaxID=253017 RepID=UPI001FB07B30|nr:non-specific lipid-transfer protein-like [Impatiens glandulifera]